MKILFQKLKIELEDLIKHPLRLLPTIVISIIWMIFSIISTFGKNVPVLRFFYALTYANGGMFGRSIIGKFFGAVGGIFGKVIFAAIINIIVISLFNKKNPFKGLRNGFNGIFKGGLNAISSFLIGGGVGFLLYFFFNITSSTQNSIISLICVLGGLIAISRQNGFLFSIIFWFLKKISKGNAPSLTTITRAITGLTMGFALCFPITFVRLPLLILLFGISLIVAGILIPSVGVKKMATAIFLIFLCSCFFLNVGKSSLIKASANSLDEITTVSFIKLEGVVGAVKGEEDYIIYRGRLRYTNGRVNKYGQPFPDLMDFDKDGEITWLDLNIQKELSHDPDWLYRPMSEDAAVWMCILTGIIGFGGGVIGSSVSGALGATSTLEFENYKEDDSKKENENNESSESNEENEKVLDTPIDYNEDLGPYITRDSSGDLNVNDPATGEERVYVSNGDGTYTNPISGATYTEEELKTSLDSRNENADLIKQDESVKNEAIEEQRNDATELSTFSKELEEEGHRAEAEFEEKVKHESYVEELSFKYGTDNEDEIRQKIAENQSEAEVEGLEQLELEKEYYDSQKYCENVKQTADVAIDVLAEIEPTGAGKAIKDTYTVASAGASNLGDMMAGEKDALGAIGQTLVDSTVGLAKNHAGDVNLTGTAGYAEKAVANIAGDGIAATTNELAKGKSLEEAQKAGSDAAVQGAINFAVDSAFDAVGAKCGSKSEDSLGSVLGSEISKEAATEGSKALASDLVKNTLTPDDPDDALAEQIFKEREEAEIAANEQASSDFEAAQEKMREKNEQDN